MAEFDNTKRAIGVGKLDDSARKDMFNKFVSAGGEVIKEKPEPKEDESKKNRPDPKIRQSTVSRGGGNDGRSRGQGSGSSSRERDSKAGSDSKSNVDLKAEYEKEISNFMARFSVKLKCWMGRVTPFGSSDLNPGFMHELSTKAKQALIECHYSGNEILGNPTHSPTLSANLDKINPLLVELIAMTQKLYNGPEITDITEPILAAPNSPVGIERIKPQIYSLFKRMYVLYPYQETLKKSFLQAYDELQKLENKPALIYATKKKKITSEIDTLFDTFFEKLYLVVIRAENKNIPLISRYMESLLDIKPEDRPGQRKVGENVPGGVDPKAKAEEAKKEAEEEKKNEEKEPVSLSKEEAYGLRLMQMYSIPKLRKKFDPRNEYNFIPDTDKAMLSLFYFKEFDDEYSFVMTTKKIDLKPVQLNGVKVDYRQKMLDIYESTRTITDQFKIYLDVMKELQKHKANPGANYIEASKKLTSIEQKRTGQSRTVRLAVKDFALKSRDILLELIKDMKSKKEIVGNMNDLITLDAMESRKRLNKKPIKQCIMEAYCYTLALHDRVESGDLYGGLVELTPEQLKESFGVEAPVESGENISVEESGLEPQTSALEEKKSAPSSVEVSSEGNEDLEDLEHVDHDDDDILPEGNPF
ncbi:hypothetical protein [Leptospira idonii]|uniref:Uncharacterized protein n=1 Tax=Leptospira idonii TaxID=1193500 RepID=A0A4R9LWE6_9LEPT|nr:hypothetical protein [Leptospira idonii]TGN18603.1 hypothetical protein EHS15_14590 [Leptospira idonii]